MTGVPSYFEEVRCHASGRWDQLEQDPEFAGPWHQLFKQVQIPRHVVSELLQNADDAEATMATSEKDQQVWFMANLSMNRMERGRCETTYDIKREWRQIMEDPWLSVDDIAAYLGIKRRCCA